MMTEREINISLEDDFGRVHTKITSKLSSPDLMDEILELVNQPDKAVDLTRDNEFIALTMLCSRIHTKMCEVHDKTPNRVYISYKDDLEDLLNKMDTSIECFNQK